jgi:hypothetical protein
VSWRTKALLGILALNVAGVVAWACVPADTRPPPGQLEVTMSPSQAYLHGTTTADGWAITFDRVLIDIGNEGFSDTCTVYGEADYDRILDLAAGSNQKVGLLNGLGQCDLRFRIGPPSTDAVLGATVTEATKDQMLAPYTDPYLLLNGPSNGAGAAIDITLHAAKGGVTKEFHLIYRRRIRFQRCTDRPFPADASAAQLMQDTALSDAGHSVDLAGHQQLVYDLQVQPEAILRDDQNPTSATLRFDAYAKADTNNDGQVTLDELRAIPISDISDAGAFEAGTYDIDDAGLLRRGQPIVIATLGDYVYELLVPGLLSFRDTGWCVAASAQRRPD